MVTYHEQTTLATRGPVDPGPSYPVKGILMVGDVCVAHWGEGANSYGSDIVELYPAVHNGERCWLRVATWNAAWGYCASGRSEYILPFEEGVKLLIER